MGKKRIVLHLVLSFSAGIFWVWWWDNFGCLANWATYVVDGIVVAWFWGVGYILGRETSKKQTTKTL